MAISNLTTGLRPGVCTSLTRPTAPYEGQVIYETDTDKALVWNGSAWFYLSTPQATEIGVWETWTPTVAATAGTITTGSVTRAKYTRINKLVICDFSYLVTTAGTAAGASLTTTLPITAATTFAGYYVGGGREYSAVGFGLTCLYVAPLVRIVDYLGAGWIQNGRGASVTYVYEAA